MGPQGRSGRGQKILPPPGFDPRTVQLVAFLFLRLANLKIRQPDCTTIASPKSKENVP